MLGRQFEILFLSQDEMNPPLAYLCPVKLSVRELIVAKAERHKQQKFLFPD